MNRRGGLFHRLAVDELMNQTERIAPGLFRCMIAAGVRFPKAQNPKNRGGIYFFENFAGIGTTPAVGLQMEELLACESFRCNRIPKNNSVTGERIRSRFYLL